MSCPMCLASQSSSFSCKSDICETVATYFLRRLLEIVFGCFKLRPGVCVILFKVSQLRRCEVQLSLARAKKRDF